MGFFLPSFSHLLTLHDSKLTRQTRKGMSRSPCPRSLCNSLWLWAKHVVYRAPAESSGQVGWGETSRRQPSRWMEHWAWRAGDWENSQLAVPILCRLPRIKPRTFLILVHRLIFPKSVMMSESLPNSSPSSFSNRSKGPALPQLQGFHSSNSVLGGSQESTTRPYLWLAWISVCKSISRINAFQLFRKSFLC